MAERYTDRTVQVPSNPSNSHYHLDVRCLQAVSPGVPLKLVVPEDVKIKLKDCHKLLLLSNFGLSI